jgi:hypothetical protein
LPVESLPIEVGRQLPANLPPEVPAVAPHVELPANPVPAVPDYPLPPATHPGPPLIVDPAPPAVQNPPPAVIPNPSPPPIGNPSSPPIANPVPPSIANPTPVSPWEVLFPGVTPAPQPSAPIPGDILSNLPRAVPPAATVTEPSIRVPVGEIVKRLAEALIRAPSALIPLPPPVLGPCQLGAKCATPTAMTP